MKTLKHWKNRVRSVYRMLKPLADSKFDFCVLTVDYLYCRLRFRVTQEEYYRFGFYDFSNHYRKKFLVKHHKKKYLRVQTKFFTLSKFLFYKRIPDLYHRDIILAPHCGQDAFLAFVRKHPKIIVKPDTGSAGLGIQVYENLDDDAAISLFSEFKKETPMICEEYVRQHDAMQKFNPYTVNTIRFLSVLVDGKAEVVAANLKSGTSADAIVDNVNTGGFGAEVDIPTGIVNAFGMAADFTRFTHHPVSGVPILGFQVPNWDAAIDLVKQAHNRLPQCLFFAWDIAITPDGADIIEANSSPSDQITQAAARIPKGEKIVPMLKKDIRKQKNPKPMLNYEEYFPNA